MLTNSVIFKVVEQINLTKHRVDKNLDCHHHRLKENLIHGIQSKNLLVPLVAEKTR